MTLNPTSKLQFSSLYRFQWENVQQKYVILYPEGMVELNQSSAEILQLCDGLHNASEIVELLEAKFNTTGLNNDIFQFLTVALKNGWIIQS